VQTRPAPEVPTPPTPAHTRRRALYVVAAFLTVVIALGAAVAYRRAASERSLADAALIGFGVDRADAVAPPIELAGLDGRRFSLASLRGQVVFVNFWATWCPPCREEMPTMVRLGQELAARHPGRFQMVAVSVDESSDTVREFFGAPPYAGNPGVTVLLDPEQVTTRAYYCTARGGSCPDLKFPETYIVDRSGRLVAYVVGPRDWSDPAARAFLEALIGS
jgi:thiol-disulfide isomerase/thioredoxin